MKMIRIGCTTFSEHGSLVNKKESKLYEYAGHFPIVELDTTYYYLPKEKDVKNWLTQVPENFRFVLKVHQSVTQQGDLPEELTMEQSLELYKKAIAPIVEAGQLFCLLAQFPNSFKCTKENVLYLKQLRQWFSGYPVAIELRDNSWYDEKYLQNMRQFMEEQEFSLVIVDEPKKLTTTIPLDPYVTNKNFVLFRFHGRNDIGWAATGPDAKRQRTLYCYNAQELNELQEAVEKTKDVQEVGVIFNNNSARDAAPNALQLKKQLQLVYEKLNPSQLELF